ncbi:MAG: SulP family inorganic anion transporter [Eubacterium ventriosum]
MNIKLLQTLRNYNKDNFIKDIIAGIIIMAVSIPISMGYAQIAGLPAVYGLYGSVFPIIIFGLFSTSPQFIFGVDAAPAALIGSALLTLNIEAGSRQGYGSSSRYDVFCCLMVVGFLFYESRKAG